MDMSSAGTESKALSDIDILINSLCASSDSVSDIVQTFAIKCLLALTTSSSCSVHEGAMLKALRTIFQIHLASKHATTRDISKAALFDMVRTVLMRLETYDSITKNEALELHSDTQPVDDDTNTTEYDDDTKSSSAASVFKDFSKGMNVDIDAVIQKDDLSTFASLFHVDTYLVFRSLCKMSAKPLPGDNTSLDGPKFLGNTPSKFINAFSVVGANAEDPMAFRSKILSLELILAMLENSGPAFCSGERFIFAIQNYLCVSLLKNCISSYMAVAQLGLKIFLVLVYKFKNHLKEEIEVFISKIFLIVLESPNSPFEQRRLVLESLRVLCSEPQVLTQMFLEYDCDFDAPDLYKNILDHLTSLVVRLLSNANTKTVVVNEKNTLHDSTLIIAGLDVLVTILRAFLKALDLPGAEDELSDDDKPTRNDKVRGLLQLDLPQPITRLHSKMSSSDDLRLHEYDTRLTSSLPSESDMNQNNPSMEPATPTASAAGSIIETFDKKREGKRNFETGIIKFSLSAKQGLMFFIETGFLKLDAKDIALFLHRNKDKLDKTQIGDLLGREPEASFVKDKSEDPERGGEGFFVRLLHHYVNAMNFVGLDFDGAIRLFLSGFRLPGEAQKVRTLEILFSNGSHDYMLVKPVSHVPRSID
jgi:brefeldin A-inhibited guanine nucleotide-exchange protein